MATTSTTPKKKRTMTAEHKASLAKGRESARAVKTYLEALSANKPKRGRQVTTETLTKRLADTKAKLITGGGDLSPMQRLELVQTRMDLESKLGETATTVDLSAAEKGFVAHAKSYSAAKGISKAA